MGVDPYAKKYGGNTHLHRSRALSKDEVKPILFNFGGDNPVIDADNTTEKNILDQILALLKDPTMKAVGSLVSVLFIGVVRAKITHQR